jgi:hypothetical protein
MLMAVYSFRNPVLYENKKLNTSAKGLIWKVGQATKSNLMYVHPTLTTRENVIGSIIEYKSLYFWTNIPARPFQLSIIQNLDKLLMMRDNVMFNYNFFRFSEQILGYTFQTIYIKSKKLGREQKK